MESFKKIEEPYFGPFERKVEPHKVLNPSKKLKELISLFQENALVVYVSMQQMILLYLRKG